MTTVPDADALQHYAFVALGSNLGTPVASVLRAMDRLQDFSLVPVIRSSLWSSEPVACPPGSPDFINAVAGLLPRPAESPRSLLKALLAMEREFGRKQGGLRNEARPLDLDLLAFGSTVCQTPELILPHPRAHLRRFVLAPLNEIAPSLKWPGTKVTVGALLAALPPDQKVQKLC